MKADANWIGQKSAQPAISAGADDDLTVSMPVRFWVQGYEQIGDGSPLMRLYPTIVMHCVSGGPVSVVVSVRSQTGITRTATLSVTNTSEETFSGGLEDLWLDTSPGTITPGVVTFTVPAGEAVIVDRISWNVIYSIGAGLG
jgi:hypothetical protein